MTSRLAWISSSLLLAAACGPSAQGTIDASGGGGEADAPPSDIDARPRPDADTTSAPDADNMTAYPDAETFADGGTCTDWVCTNPLPDNCDIGGPEICNDGTDQNCNGMVDEGCTCTPGSVQPCFLGNPGQRGVGACIDGMQTCFGSGEFTYWGECMGGIRPSSDACDTLDNDCDGCVDDNPACCEVLLDCPGPGEMPVGQPFQNYVIDGTAFWSGPAASWQWTVSGGPCDQLFEAQGQPVSYTLTGANTPQLTFRPTLSGDYTVTMTVTLPDGTTESCTFIVHIEGPGLRIEACWDTAGDVDVDLHVHRPGTTSPWFTTNLNNSTVNGDDCYYRNCVASPFIGTPVNWGYANSPLANCSGGPDGAAWTSLGYCRNPRLDIDNISDEGVPENINVDLPQNNGTYRVMLHYYSGTRPTKPIVNIYCGGTLQASYGVAPDVVPNFDTAGGFGAGDMWRVVDVTTQVAGTTTTCTPTALHPPGMTSGYWVTTNDRSY
jgi:hypothetical protein